MPMQPRDTLNGALDLLILKTLTLGPNHGWGIGQRIQETSRGVLDVNQGSLYPALQRLERARLIASSWGTTDNHRQARYYRITAAGRRALGADMDSWRRISAAVELVLQAT
jgi:PadR family transcriptional regulator, regulatory protein PadR